MPCAIAVRVPSQPSELGSATLVLIVCILVARLAAMPMWTKVSAGRLEQMLTWTNVPDGISEAVGALMDFPHALMPFS